MRNDVKPSAQAHEAGTLMALTWSRENLPGWAITTLFTRPVPPKRTQVAPP